ncbi:MAG: proline--tRNA ligase [Oscillospiraceae bacterium]|nr:proline--tRNA ligase [Oscillospiraceae bacterium]
MADKTDKKLLEEITPIEEDFAQWYTDIVKKAELIDYSSVKGCVILRPYGYAVWENIQKIIDNMFKKTGHSNVYMPLFIPETLLNKEKDHIEGFAPEVAWVTRGGSEELTEKLCVRPTSETLFCEHYANTVKSYRDLPKLYNQWCSVVRWEKTTRPFLRTREFLWQEGHTVHATHEDALEETLRMLDVYADFCENYLCMPVVKGQKTDKEKFAGAVATYTVESMMHDGKALQAGTSHYFGDKFAKAFDIKYLDKNNELKYCFQTSWGISTRLIGGIIMAHGDNRGLVLPPAVAPVQIRIMPIASHKPGVLEKAGELKNRLEEKFRCDIDLTDTSAGFKFAEQEMRGIPLRLEIGPKDIEQNQCVFVRRDTSEKITCSIDVIESKAEELLNLISKNLYEKALENRRNKTFTAKNLDEIIEIAKTSTGFIKAMWCGDEKCEVILKEKADISSRCIVDEDHISDTCVCCGKKADKLLYWGTAY